MTEYYKSKYRKKTIRERWHQLLFSSLKYIANSKAGKYLDPLDKFQISHLDKTKSFNTYFLKHSKKKISLRRIEFIEVIELDDLAILEKQILKIIRKNKFYNTLQKGVDLPASEIVKIKERINEFKTSYKTWSSGKFFELTNENPNFSTDLYEYISFTYFKSYDNLLVLKLDVKPSKKFFKYLKKINTNETIPNDIPLISHFKDFLKNKRIISGYGATVNLKEKGFHDLVFDLNYQIREKFLDGMNGIFSIKKEQNPFIVYFNTKSILDYKELKKGFGIFDHFDLSDIFYDQEKAYYMFSYWRSSKKGKGLYIIAEDDGFQKSIKKENQDKRLNKYVFSNSIYKSWAIVNYLKTLNRDLKDFRRIVYHFINSQGNIKFRKQIRIKTELSQKKIRFQRIEREFNKTNLDFYLLNNDYESNLLRAINNGWGRNKNYHGFIRDQINYFISDGKEQLNDMDNYFEEISSINLVKLNYRFQIIAIILTLLGLVFAVANAEDIFNLIKKLWE